MKLYKSAHTVYKTKISYGLTLPIPKEDFANRNKKLSENKASGNKEYYPDWEYIEIGIKKDHVYLYMVIPPKYTVSNVVETIKKNTSRSLSRKFAFLKKVYWERKGVWGKGYFVSTVGINEEVIRRYVQSQKEEEIGQAKLEF